MISHLHVQPARDVWSPSPERQTLCMVVKNVEINLKVSIIFRYNTKKILYDARKKMRSMTDVQFFSNMPEHIKRITSNIKHLCKVVVYTQTPLTLVEISEAGGFACGANLYTKSGNVRVLGPRTNPRAPTEWGEIPHVHAKLYVNRCNKSPLSGENAHFRPLNKRNTGICRFVESCR